MKKKGVRKTYGPVDVIKEHVDKKSELYGPLMRHGENPKRWHQVIDDHNRKYKAQYLGYFLIYSLKRQFVQLIIYLLQVSKTSAHYQDGLIKQQK